MERKFLMVAFGYGILGLLLGIHMAATQNHLQHVTHAHIMLIGFVVSFIYAVCSRLWVKNNFATLAKLQFHSHLWGSVVLLIALFSLYGGLATEAVLGPVLGISSILVLLSLILMKVMLIKATK